MSWQQEAIELRQAGFTDDEIAMEGSSLRKEMGESGFQPQEIDEYFGTKEPDMKPIKDLVKNNLMAANEKEAEKRANSTAKEAPPVSEADSFLQALDAGFQMSSTDMIRKAYKGKSVTPDMILPEDAPMGYRIAAQMGTIAGDLPAMIAGAVFGAAPGAAAGSAVPVVGTGIGAIVGAGAGSNAVPAAIRESLMQYYEKGEIQDFGDFWERTSAVFLDTLKEGAIGGVSAGVGGKVLKAASKVAAPATSRIASTASEISTMVAVGKGLEGEMPRAQDFTDAAILIGGMHVSAGAASKLRKTFAKTGVKPHEVLQDAQVDPVLKQEIVTLGDELPSKYKGMVQEELPLAPKAEPKVETPPAELTSQDKILSKIGETADTPKKKYTFDEFYKDTVDKLDPIKQAVEQLGDAKDIPIAENPYVLSRMVNDSKAKTLHFFEKGSLDFNTLEVKGKPFKEIIAPHKSDIPGLKAYLVSKRAIDLEARGIKSGFDVEAAKEVVANGYKFETAAKELVEFQNSSLKYLKDSGVIGDKAYDSMVEAGKSYISFKRIREDGSTSGGSKKNPIKKIKGSDLSIQDPFVSMMENMQVYIELAEKNRATLALVKLAEKDGAQTLIERVKQPKKAIQVSADEVNLALKKQGIEVDAEAFTIFRNADKTLAPDEFMVFRDGKPEVYKTDPILAESLKVLDGNQPAQHFAIRAMRSITQVKRTAISMTPDFILRNAMRDWVTSKVFSKANPSFLNHVADTFGAMGDIWMKNDNYYNWLKSGGANGAFLELGDKYLKDNVYNIDKQSGGFIDKTFNVVKKPYHFLQVASQLIEQAPRLAEAKRITKGATSGKKIFESGIAAREITIDFQRVGAKTAALNSITAFMNASVQGLDRTARALKEDPIGITKKSVISITTPSVLLWWANKDDERYKEVPRWQKDLFWIIPTDDWTDAEVGEGDMVPDHLKRMDGDKLQINKGTIWKIPKPMELGILFGSIPERILDGFFTDNPDSFKDFDDTIKEMLIPAFVPDFIAPVLEQSVNKSFFTQNEIVPGHLQEILPQHQYTDYTSDTAKALGKMIMAVPYAGPAFGEIGPKDAPLASPMVLENYIRSWSGSMGMYALKLADKGLQAAGLAPDPVKPESTLADIPFIKAFVVRYPNAGAKSLTDFREKFEENSKYLNTIKFLSKSGQLDDAQEIMNAEENQEFLQNLSGVQDAIKNQGMFIRSIYKNPDITSVEKRQLIDGAYYGMIESARMGLKMNKEWKKSLEEQKKRVEGK